MRIYFDKLLNGEYPLEVEMEMINWFLKTGNEYDEYTGRWNKDGVSKQMFGYSANSHSASFPFPIVCESYIGNPSFNFNVLKMFVQSCLYNVIIKKPTIPVAKWRKAERIELGRFRELKFNLSKPENPKHRYTHLGLHELKNFIGMDLKKELFHAKYEERTDPKVVHVRLYTNGDGYVFEYVFSFECFNYEPGWSKYIRQKEDESIACFVNRIYDEMDLVRDDSKAEETPKEKGMLANRLHSFLNVKYGYRHANKTIAEELADQLSADVKMQEEL